MRDMPHTRPTARWPGTSLENLGTPFRTTPFVWPLSRSASGGASPGPRTVSPYIQQDHTRARDADTNNDAPDNAAVGSTTARPRLEGQSTSSGILRRLRSARSGFGFPFGPNSRNTSNSGYRTLEDEQSTPSSNMRHATTGPSSLSLSTPSPFMPPPLGHVAHDSNDSSDSSAMRSRTEHKSPLPPSYQQHVSNNSHGSHGSRFSLPTTGQQPPLPSQPLPATGEVATEPVEGNPFEDGLAQTIPITSGRLDATPHGPRPLAGARDASFSGLSASLLRRPDMDRVDTGGSVWEVPPTYNSLARRHGSEEPTR